MSGSRRSLDHIRSELHDATQPEPPQASVRHFGVIGQESELIAPARSVYSSALGIADRRQTPVVVLPSNCSSGKERGIAGRLSAAASGAIDAGGLGDQRVTA